MDAPKKRGRPRGPAFRGEITDVYSELEEKAWSVRQITDELERRFPNQAPDARTIQRWVSRDRSTDTGPWRVSMTQPEDVPSVFASIQAAMDATHRRVRWVSASEARWIVRISKLGAAVQLTPFQVWAQARRSARADARDAGDYSEDMRLGVVTELLDMIDFGAARTLEEWIERGPG